MTLKNRPPATVEETITQFIDAGIGLVMLPFSIAQNSLKITKKETFQQFDSLQKRGEKVEGTIRNALSPTTFCNKLTNTFTSKSVKTAKLEQLSHKVDSLVEAVATLAAKQAAEIVDKPKSSSAKASTTQKSTTTRRRTTTKTQKDDAVKPSTVKTGSTSVKATANTKSNAGTVESKKDS